MPVKWKGADAKGQFDQFVKRSGHSPQQKLEENSHNIMDHGGKKHKLTLYDENKEEIPMKELENSNQKFLLQEDDCHEGFTALIDDLIQMFNVKDSRGLGFYSLGFISFLSNDVEKVFIVSIKQIIMIELPSDDLPTFWREDELTEEHTILLNDFDIPLIKREKGTKMLMLLKENVCFTEEAIHETSKLNSLNSYYSDDLLEGPKYVYPGLKPSYKWKGVTNLYFKHSWYRWSINLSINSIIAS